MDTFGFRCPKPPANLRRLDLSGNTEIDYEEMEEEFREFNLVVSTKWSKRGKRSALVQLPNWFSCKVVLGGYLDISYKKGYPDSDSDDDDLDDYDLDDDDLDDDDLDNDDLDNIARNDG